MKHLLEPIVGSPYEVTVLKEKPGRRRTMRIDGPLRSAIVKIYASDRARVVAQRLESIQEGPPDPVVPRVLAVDDEHRAVVLSYVPGTTLGRAARCGDSRICRRAGAAIGRWHRHWATVPVRDGLAPHTAEREIAILRERASTAGPIGKEVLALLDRTDVPPWAPSTVVHRDLYEEQILNAEHTGLIDLDDSALGPPELDVGNLLAHLDLFGLRLGRDLAAAATTSFLTGYTTEGPPLDDMLLASLRRLSRTRLACIHAEPRLLAVD